MFKQLHINITLADALILIPKYQKMLKALLSNKEKLLELANTPLNEICSAVILKKLLEKLVDPRKFLIRCGFSLPELISTRMTIELANRAICTPTGIAKDVFVPVGKFTFLADFVIVDYESDPRVPLILGRPFLRTARALIDIHREEMMLRDGDERLTLNMRHDTSSYLNQPQKESINLINIFNDLKGGNVQPEKLLYLYSTKDLHPPHHVNPLSGSTTSSSPNQLLEEFANEFALITFPPGNDDLPFDIDNLADLNDNLADSMPGMFTDEHALDYSSPPLYYEYDDDLFEVESETEYVMMILSTPRERKSKRQGIYPRYPHQENLFEVITRVAPEKNEKKLAIYHGSLILEDFDPPLYELPCFKEVPIDETPLSFSFENEEKVFKP
nr:reverse transcriptase domain-containing protein [Tanacetum cinerariifolium]